jgi:glycerol-3-phosphate acyltransferase PlsY
MVGDMLKGILAVSLYNLLPYYLTNELDRTNLMIGLGLAAVIGHIYPIWADFRGGKGVATLFGMVLAIQPIVAINCVGVFLLVLYLTRYVSLSSIIAGVALPICVLWIYNEKEVFYRVFAVAVAALIVLTHQKNISRLIKGNEGRVPILKHRDRRKSRRKELE